jgi:hypothetical protein
MLIDAPFALAPAHELRNALPEPHDRRTASVTGIDAGRAAFAPSDMAAASRGREALLHQFGAADRRHIRPAVNESP